MSKAKNRAKSQLMKTCGKMARLQEERDAALRLAEETEAKMVELKDEMEDHMQAGYEEAYNMLQQERQALQQVEQEKAKLEDENEWLSKLNEHLAAAAKLDISFCESVMAEYKKKEGDIANEYADQFKKQRDIMVEKLDAFLKIQTENLEAHIALEKCKELQAKGGKELVKEVLGEEGIAMIEEMEQEEKAQRLKEEQRKQEAKEIRQKAIQAKDEEHAKQMRKLAREQAIEAGLKTYMAPMGNVACGSGGIGPYEAGQRLAKALGGNPYYKRMKIGYSKEHLPTVEEKVKQMAKEAMKKKGNQG